MHAVKSIRDVFACMWDDCDDVWLVIGQSIAGKELMCYTCSCVIRKFHISLNTTQCNNIYKYTLKKLPIFYNKWEKIRHGGSPQFSQRIIVETSVKRDNVVDVFLRHW